MEETQLLRQPIVTICGHVDHGKCVTGDTLIPLLDGTIITAKELFENNFENEKSEKRDDGLIQDVSEKLIKIFSFDGKKIIPKNISHIWKRKAKKLIEIKLTSGDIIKTTPEHPFFILSGLDKKWKRADELTENEYVAIPSKINLQNSETIILIINKVKSLNNFVCFIKENSSIFKRLKKINISELERKLKIKNLRDSIKNKRFRIKDFFMLTSNFNFTDTEAYYMIDSIKNSNEEWRAGHTSKTMNLPNLNELEKLGYILGCIAGDGHLSQTNITLNNNDREIKESYQRYLKEVFNIESKFKRTHTCDTIIDCSGKTFVRFISEVIGIPQGNKSGIVSVPEIAKKNKEIFKGFLSGLFDTDGYVSIFNNSIEITSKSNLLLKECAILLLNFGIHAIIYKKNNYYTLRIANKIYLERFLESFNPRLKRKLERIINASKKAETSRIFDFLPISGEILKKLKMTGKINKKIPYFNKYSKSNKISKWLIHSTLENIKVENETSKKLRDLLEQDLDYVQVISKKEIENKDKYVYDFTIPDTSNFVAERILVHNTSILDHFRGTSIQEAEAGGITQKISFTLYPTSQIQTACPLILKSGIKLNIPGFLFIDTPGHAAFTNLRKRGGSLADLAILVIDINEGIKPQTAEVIQILKFNKTPFLIALNKIDNISGWRTNKQKPLKENIESQPINVKSLFDERYMTIAFALSNYGFESDLYYNIEDFTKKIALIPCSARTGEGIQELMMMLCGLSQKYLTQKLKLNEEAKGIILEVKKEKANECVEAILYDGKLKKNDEIAVANIEGNPIITKVRAIEEIQPLSTKFSSKDKVTAATGLRMQFNEKIDILPGMPFLLYNHKDKDKVKEIFKKELTDTIKTEKKGIIAKADSLGSLEALLVLLKQSNIPVLKAGIGNINKTDFVNAKANLEIDELDAIILGFNISINEDTKELLSSNPNIKVLTEEVVYRLIERLQETRENLKKEIEKQKLMTLTTLCKLEILHQYIFRITKPAIFGIKVLAGKLNPNVNLIDETEQEIGRVKNIQSEKNSVPEAQESMEVAISIPGVNYEKQLQDKKFLYSNISERQFKEFKKNKELLSQNEIKILQEIAELKRKNQPEWGI